MPSFTGNKYPEELRVLRAQYPNTQFDSHGRVVGGMPLNQYNAQPANPAAIPASVRTYSQFDPATGTWVRHTNGAVPAQSPVQGMTPTDTPGILLRPRQQAQPQPTQVMRPLARNVRGPRTARNTEITVNPVVVNGEEALATNNMGKTPSGVEFVKGQPVAVPMSTEPLEVTPVLNMSPDHRESTPYVYSRFPVQVQANPSELGQSVPKAEVTPTIRENGFLTWLGNTLGFHSSSNLDPTLSNHSDPRW